MVELIVPYESRMEEAHAFKEGKYLDLTKELKKDGYKAKLAEVVRCHICNQMYTSLNPWQETQVGSTSREASGSHDLDVAQPP
ncbi:hypothetical protein PoB_003359600 [Plakobranchus ocellatus]|uniref:Uncharacterized protein n=1 Tax=Plakobranchus ocellatus TaxID=259542 RepID=A0AAV4A791_9GAST|nr:hypothetical protein PoB_003359600 [Plakobranchus ocellatus]